MRNTVAFRSGVLAALVACVAMSPQVTRGGLVEGVTGAEFGNSYLASGYSLETFGFEGELAQFDSTHPTFVYNVTILNSEENLFGIGGAVSTRLPDYSILITFTSGNVTGVGADFFLTDEGGVPTSGSFALAFNTSAGPISPFTGLGADFYGFTTAGGTYITSLTISPETSGAYMTFDNLYVGAAVPEPTTWFAAGFVGLVVAGRYGRSLYARLAGRN